MYMKENVSNLPLAEKTNATIFYLLPLHLCTVDIIYVNLLVFFGKVCINIGAGGKFGGVLKSKWSKERSLNGGKYLFSTS